MCKALRVLVRIAIPHIIIVVVTTLYYYANRRGPEASNPPGIRWGSSVRRVSELEGLGATSTSPLMLALSWHRALLC